MEPIYIKKRTPEILDMEGYIPNSFKLSESFEQELKMAYSIPSSDSETLDQIIQFKNDLRYYIKMLPNLLNAENSVYMNNFIAMAFNLYNYLKQTNDKNLAINASLIIGLYEEFESENIPHRVTNESILELRNVIDSVVSAALPLSAIQTMQRDFDKKIAKTHMATVFKHAKLNSEEPALRELSLLLDLVNKTQQASEEYNEYHRTKCNNGNCGEESCYDTYGNCDYISEKEKIEKKAKALKWASSYVYTHLFRPQDFERSLIKPDTIKIIGEPAYIMLATLDENYLPYISIDYDRNILSLISKEDLHEHLSDFEISSDIKLFDSSFSFDAYRKSLLAIFVKQYINMEKYNGDLLVDALKETLIPAKGKSNKSTELVDLLNEKINNKSNNKSDEFGGNE